MFATRVYVFVLVLSLAGIVAVEVVPREMGRFSNRDLGNRQYTLERALSDMTARLGRGEVALGDEMRLASMKKKLVQLRRETQVRTARTGAFVLLALASAVFALVTAPRILLRRRAPTRKGTVEVEPDETLDIDASDAVHFFRRV